MRRQIMLSGVAEDLRRPARGSSQADRGPLSVLHKMLPKIALGHISMNNYGFGGFRLGSIERRRVVIIAAAGTAACSLCMSRSPPQCVMKYWVGLMGGFQILVLVADQEMVTNGY